MQDSLSLSTLIIIPDRRFTVSTKNEVYWAPFYGMIGMTDLVNAYPNYPSTLRRILLGFSCLRPHRRGFRPPSLSRFYPFSMSARAKRRMRYLAISEGIFLPFLWGVKERF